MVLVALVALVDLAASSVALVVGAALVAPEFLTRAPSPTLPTQALSLWVRGGLEELVGLVAASLAKPPAQITASEIPESSLHLTINKEPVVAL